MDRKTGEPKLGSLFIHKEQKIGVIRRRRPDDDDDDDQSGSAVDD